LQFAALFAADTHLAAEIQFVSLQKEARATDVPNLATLPELLHFGDELKTFSDTAALCDAMDLVISVDTSVAHLAGALGKPTWLMLPFHPDWRWLLDRTDSPWYPTMRLYRQPAPCDWASVIATIRNDLLQHFGLTKPSMRNKRAPRPTCSSRQSPTAHSSHSARTG
jgi:hypothetical protein